MRGRTAWVVTNRSSGTKLRNLVSKASDGPMLEVRGLTKKYRNIAVVDHVTFTVPPGEVTGYLGPNGSGKSTTVKMLAGLLPATAGHILWNGTDIRTDLIGFKRKLGYVPEEAFVYPH